MEENKKKIRAFLGDYFRNQHWRDDEDIFSEGPVNSLFAMQLVLFIENEFGVQLDNQDLVLDNFRTIDRLANLIDRKQSIAS